MAASLRAGASSGGLGADCPSTNGLEVEDAREARNAPCDVSAAHDARNAVTEFIEGAASNSTATNKKNAFQWPPPLKDCLNGLVNVVICLNAVELALAVDLRGDDWNEIWFVCDNFFTSFFVLEFAVKFSVLRRKYFYDRWRYVDFLLMLIGVLETWVLAGKQKWRRLTLLRSLRLVRLVRVIKVLASRRELVMVVEGIGSSLGAMCWIAALMAFAILNLAIFCTEIIGHAEGYDISPCGGTSIKEMFGNVARSTITLLNIALLAEWPEIIRPILDRQMYLVPFFVTFVGVTTLGVLNVIVGIIVDRTNAASDALKEVESTKVKADKLEAVLRFADIVYSCDDGCVRTLTRRDLQATSEDVDRGAALRKVLDAVDLPFGFDIMDVHTMLDVNGDGRIQMEELVTGMARLIKNTPFQENCLAQLARGRLQQSIHGLKMEVQEGFAKIHTDVAALRAQLERSAPEVGFKDKPPNAQTEKTNATREDASLGLSISGVWERLPDTHKQVSEAAQTQSRRHDTEQQAAFAEESPQAAEMPSCNNPSLTWSRNIPPLVAGRGHQPCQEQHLAEAAGEKGQDPTPAVMLGTACEGGSGSNALVICKVDL